MSIEGQGHFFTIYFPDFVCFVLYKATISGECLQDHWSSGLILQSAKINRHENVLDDKNAKINSREKKLIYSNAYYKQEGTSHNR